MIDILRASSLCFMVVGAVMSAASLWSGVTWLSSYWSVKPSPVRTFESVRVTALEWRTVAVPALIALLASFLAGGASSVAVMDSHLHASGFPVLSGEHVTAGLLLLIPAIVVLMISLGVLLGKKSDAEELARDPQTIALAAMEIPGDAIGDRQRTSLSRNLQRWSRERGERALKVRVARSSRVQNATRRLLRGIPPQANMRMRDVRRPVVPAIWLMVRAHPIQIGWVLYGPMCVVVGLLIRTWSLLIGDQLALPDTAPHVTALFVFLIVAGPMALWARLMTARRTLGNELSHFPAAVSELRAARSRAASLRERDELLQKIALEIHELHAAMEPAKRSLRIFRRRRRS